MEVSALVMVFTLRLQKSCDWLVEAAAVKQMDRSGQPEHTCASDKTGAFIPKAVHLIVPWASNNAANTAYSSTG